MKRKTKKGRHAPLTPWHKLHLFWNLWPGTNRKFLFHSYFGVCCHIIKQSWMAQSVFQTWGAFSKVTGLCCVKAFILAVTSENPVYALKQRYLFFHSLSPLKLLHNGVYKSKGVWRYFDANVHNTFFPSTREPQTCVTPFLFSANTPQRKTGVSYCRRLHRNNYISSCLEKECFTNDPINTWINLGYLAYL